MKHRWFLIVPIVAVVSCGAWWLSSGIGDAAHPTQASGTRQVAESTHHSAAPKTVRAEADPRTSLQVGEPEADPNVEGQSAELVVTVAWSTGEPARTVAVLLDRQGASVPLVRSTDELGRVSFAELEPGPWLLTCAHGGRESIDIHPGRNATVLNVPRGETVDVEVVDIRGVGIADAQVVMSAHGTTSWAVVAGTTDTEGRLHLRDIGDDRSLCARKRGYEPSPCVPVELMPGAETLTATLRLAEGGASLEGRVRDITDGRLIEGATIRVRGGNRRMAQALDLPERGIERIHDLPAPIDTATDSSGTFRLESLPSGTLELEVHSADYATTRRFIDLPSAGDHAWIDVDLAPSEVLRGRVVSEGGASCNNVLVWAGTPRASRSRHAYSDADGNFVFRGLDSGIRQLEAWGAGGFHGSATIDNAAPDALVEIRISRSVEPTGTLRGPGGEPLDGWTITREPPAAAGSSAPPRSAIARTDEHGRFWLRPADSTEGTLWIWSPIGAAPFPVASRHFSESDRLGVISAKEVGPWSTIEFFVEQNADSTERVPTIVRLVQLSTGYTATHSIGDRAESRFDGLPSGTYAVRYVMDLDDLRDGGELVLAPGSEQRVDVPRRAALESLPRAEPIPAIR